MRWMSWIIITGLVFFYGTVQGQEEPTITASFLNTPLPLVLNELEQDHQVLFAYDKVEVEGIFVHTYLDNTPLELAIQQILADSGMEFMAVGKSEYLIRKDRTEQLNPLILSGKILCSEQNIPLEWATVYDETSRQLAYTDDQGNFTLRMVHPKTSGNIIIEYLGYAQKTIGWNATDRNYMIQLDPEPIELRTIEIVQRLPSLRQQVRAGQYRKVSSTEKLILGAAGVADELAPFRFLPSINATTDLSSGLNVRGGDESENLYLLDNIEFWNVGHFFGVFSAFEPKMIDSTSLYLTDFPVEFGGRTSGVVDMKMHHPEIGNWKGFLDIHSLYTNFQLNIPLTKKAGILWNTRFTNGRISESDIIDVVLDNNDAEREISNPRNEEFIVSIVPDYSFNDTQIKWFWQPNKKSRWSLSLAGGRDDYAGNSDLTEQRQGNIQLLNLRHIFSEKISWTNGGFNLSYDGKFSNIWSSEVDISGSSQETQQALNASLIIERKFRKDTIAVGNRNQNEVAGGGLKWTNRLLLHNRQKITFGMEAENHRSEVSYIQDTFHLIRRDTSTQFSFFFSHALPLHDRWNVEYGFRSTFYAPTRKTYLSPRLSTTYRPGTEWELGASVGYYNQFLRTLVYEDAFGKIHDIWLLADKSIPVLQSLHFNAHAQYRKDQFLIKLDVFRKNSTNELRQMWLQRGFDPVTGNPRNSNLMTFQGDGNTLGFDLFSSWSTSKWSSSIAYTWSRSQLSIPNIDNGRPIPGNNDRRHELNYLNEWYWGQWTLGLGVIYGSGLPYTSSLVVDGSDRRNLTIEESVQRLDDYLRMDFSVTYDFTLWKDKWSIGFSVFNLTDRANTDQIQYLYNLSFLNSGSPTTSVFGSETQLLPRTVDLQIIWRFD